MACSSAARTAAWDLSNHVEKLVNTSYSSGTDSGMGAVFVSDLSYGMSPFLPDDPDGELRALASYVAQRSANLTPQASGTQQALRALLRTINTYQSNRIEGQGTHPIDIDRAVRSQNLNLAPDVSLALAMIEAEAAIDRQTMAGPPGELTTVDALCDLHCKIFSGLPEKARLVSGPDGRTAVVVPGELRDRDVAVGHHVAGSSRELTSALQAFDRQYRVSAARRSAERGLIAAAAAHHRLAYLHPFLDGNGRVARMFSRIYIDSVLAYPALWSLSRGLARSREAYYCALSNADAARESSTSGRGSRSAKGLHEFCVYFLTTCLDQVDFMAKRLDINGYKERVTFLVDRAAAGAIPDMPRLDPGAAPILFQLFLRGELERAEAWRQSGYKERKGRDVVGQLFEVGLASADSPRGVIRPAFPAVALEILFPGLAGPM